MRRQVGRAAQAVWFEVDREEAAVARVPQRVLAAVATGEGTRPPYVFVTCRHVQLRGSRNSAKRAVEGSEAERAYKPGVSRGSGCRLARVKGAIWMVVARVGNKIVLAPCPPRAVFSFAASPRM